MYRYADTHKLALVRCRGIRRMHLNSNMSACEQAPVSQFGSSVHGSLLRANFQSCEEIESNRNFEFVEIFIMKKIFLIIYGTALFMLTMAFLLTSNYKDYRFYITLIILLAIGKIVEGRINK